VRGREDSEEEEERESLSSERDGSESAAATADTDEASSRVILKRKRERRRQKEIERGKEAGKRIKRQRVDWRERDTEKRRNECSKEVSATDSKRDAVQLQPQRGERVRRAKRDAPAERMERVALSSILSFSLPLSQCFY